MEGQRVVRDELHKQVWSQPMTEVAKSYGITATGLAKICTKLEVPRPPQGHWQRVQHGLKIDVPSLPELSVDGLNETRPGTGAGLTLSELGSVAPKIEVCATLSRPHSFVKQAKESLSNCKPSQDGLLWTGRGQLAVRVTKNQLSRALLTFDALLKAAEQKGWSVRTTNDGDPKVVIQVEGEGLSVSIQEKLKQVEHVMSAEEKRRIDAGQYVYAPKYDHFPSGVLTLKINEGDYLGIRHCWTDGARRQVEGCLGEVIVSLDAIARKLRERALERQLQEKEWARQAELRRAEEERVKRFEQQLASWEKAKRIRSFADAMDELATKLVDKPESAANVQRQATWARKYADQFDPLVFTD